MTCEEMTKLLSARMDGELTEEENTALEAHLASCPECRALSAQLEQLRGAFSDLEDIPAPEGFSHRVMEQIRPEAEQPKVVPLFRRPAVKALMGAAACLVLCVGLLGGGFRHNDGGEAVPFAVSEDGSPDQAEAKAKTFAGEENTDGDSFAGMEGERPPLEGQQVTVSDSFGSLTLTVPEGWEYETAVNDGGKTITFGPKGEQGRISLTSTREPAAVCGTGLETEEKTFGDGTVVQISTYDHHGLWDFIDLGEEPGTLVAWSQEGVERWWKDQGETAMDALFSAVVTENTEN